MIMSLVYIGMLSLSLVCAMQTGQTAALSSAVTEGAQKGITLCISIAGPLCLWSGIGKLMEASGLTRLLSCLLRPLLYLVFPSCRTDSSLQQLLSANICANILGLGNAATPMGIRAVKRMVNPRNHTCATHEMCRLVVLNTASIQLIPANVAAVRSSLGCTSPFDILPAVWITSLCSAGIGLLSALFFRKVLSHD